VKGNSLPRINADTRGSGIRKTFNHKGQRIAVIADIARDRRNRERQLLAEDLPQRTQRTVRKSEGKSLPLINADDRGSGKSERSDKKNGLGYA
jgi:hypothetical protein